MPAGLVEPLGQNQTVAMNSIQEYVCQVNLSGLERTQVGIYRESEKRYFSRIFRVLTTSHNGADSRY